MTRNRNLSSDKFQHVALPAVQARQRFRSPIVEALTVAAYVHLTAHLLSFPRFLSLAPFWFHLFSYFNRPYLQTPKKARWMSHAQRWVMNASRSENKKETKMRRRILLFKFPSRNDRGDATHGGNKFPLLFYCPAVRAEEYFASCPWMPAVSTVVGESCSTLSKSPGFVRGFPKCEQEFAETAQFFRMEELPSTLPFLIPSDIARRTAIRKQGAFRKVIILCRAIDFPSRATPSLLRPQPFFSVQPILGDPWCVSVNVGMSSDLAIICPFAFGSWLARPVSALSSH